jgi:hypothetical protein
VLLFEDEDGQAFFEYDLPSTLFDQFHNLVVSGIGLELDQELEEVLTRAAGL